MSDQPFYRVELPAKFLTLPGNLTERQARDTMVKTLKDYVEANMQLVQPEPEPEEVVDVEVTFTDDAGVSQQAEEIG